MGEAERRRRRGAIALVRGRSGYAQPRAGPYARRPACLGGALVCSACGRSFEAAALEAPLLLAHHHEIDVAAAIRRKWLRWLPDATPDLAPTPPEG